MAIINLRSSESENIRITKACWKWKDYAEIMVRFMTAPQLNFANNMKTIPHYKRKLIKATSEKEYTQLVLNIAQFPWGNTKFMHCRSLITKTFQRFAWVSLFCKNNADILMNEHDPRLNRIYYFGKSMANLSLFIRKHHSQLKPYNIPLIARYMYIRNENQ